MTKINLYNQSVDLPDLDVPALTAWVQHVAATFGKTVGELTYVFCDDNYILDTNKSSEGTHLLQQIDCFRQQNHVFRRERNLRDAISILFIHIILLVMRRERQGAGRTRDYGTT